MALAQFNIQHLTFNIKINKDAYSNSRKYR